MLSLSGRKFLFIMGALFSLVFLSACAQAQAAASSGPGSAINEGLLMPIELAELVEEEDIRFRLTPVERMDLSTLTGVVLSTELTEFHRLTFEGVTGDIEIKVEVGDPVNEGDLLATLTNEVTPEMTLEYMRARNRLNQFERDFDDTIAAHFRNISIALDNYYTAHIRDREQMALLLRQAEIRLERFEFDMELHREALQEELSELGAFVYPEEMRSPVSGRVSHTTTTRVLSGTSIQVVTIANEDSMLLEAPGDAQRFVVSQAPASGVLRHGMTITVQSVSEVEDEDGEFHPMFQFDALVASDPWSRGIRVTPRFEIVPIDPTGLMESIEEAGMTAIQFLMRAERFYTHVPVDIASYAPAVHISALMRDHFNGDFLLVYDDGVFLKRYVRTGVRSGDYIQIISGVEEGVMAVIFE